MIQQAISQVITPIFDRDFHEKGPNINLGSLATLEDITDNPLNLKFEELDAAQLAATLSDVAVAIINTNFATAAGLSLKDAIFVDADYPDQLNELYKNVVAATAATKNNESSLRVVELYQTEAVAQAIYDLSNGGDKAIWEGGPVLGQQQLLPNFAFLITVELADRMIYRPVPHSEFIMSQ